LLVSMTLVTYDEMALEALTLHAPVIRNDLLLLFSGIESGPLMAREGKEAMRKSILEIVRKIMLERYGSEAVEDVLFTRFMMQ
jgi:flagellar FliL protein